MDKLILGQYRNSKTLGTGAYGKVYLVTDKKEDRYAIKTITKASLKQQPYLQQYLDGQIKCMLQLDCPHIMKLYDYREDEDFKYLICEYCEDGDLLNLQAKQSNKVFKFETAIEIICEIVKGLEYVHSKGYIHRDIKSQNVLVKRNPNGPSIFKLADFGFAKKLAEVSGTILGTQPYMAPEIFDADQYDFSVDIWALGVLLYFMLNMDFPFKFTNPHASNEQKRDELRKQAGNFSYTKMVEKSKKKLKINCSDEMQDFFQKVFNLDSFERLTFLELREHELFKKHFPTIPQDSKILYKKKQPTNEKQKYLSKSGIEEPEIIYVQERQFLQVLFNRSMTLLLFDKEIKNSEKYWDEKELISLRYCFQKYHCLLLEKFIKEDTNIQALKKIGPSLKWEQFCKSQQYDAVIKQYKAQLKGCQEQLESTKKSCEKRMKQISSLNKFFTKQFIKAKDQNNILVCFRECLRIAYSKLRNLYKKDKKNEYVQLLTILTISFAYPLILEASQKQVKKILRQYFEDQGTNGYNFINIKKWVWLANIEDLKITMKTIVKMYF